MTYRIQTKKSDIAALKPHPSELLPGELAVNYSDMILYALGTDGAVHQISGSGGGGDLVAMDYTFWVKVVQDGQSRTRFEGTDDAGNAYDVNVKGFDVALNGVSIVPITDYSIDEYALILSEPAEPGDVIIIRSLKASDAASPGSLTTNDIALLGDDTTEPKGYQEWVADNNLQTQQDANWFLLHRIDGLEVPEDQDLSKYETVVKSEADDADTLEAAKDYTDDAIAAIPPAGSVDLSDYALTTYVDAANKNLQDQVDSLSTGGGYNDAWIQPAIDDGDNTTLSDAKAYTDDEIDARISQGEIVQAQIVAQIETGLEEQASIQTDVLGKMGLADQNEVTSNFRIKSSSKTFISASGSELGLYNLRTPTDDSHAVNLGYANQHYQSFQKPIGFKFDQSGVCTSNTIPNSGEFCGLNNTAAGSSTNANPYFGNWNAGIRVHIDKLLNPQGNQFEVMERYSIAGTVSIFGKDTGKLFFRHGITAVVRDSSHPYVALVFATRIPTFGTGSITAESKYVVIVDGLTALETKTTLITEGGESNG